MVRSRQSMDVKLPLITPSLSSPVAGALPAGSKRETSSETRLDMVLRIWDERSRPVGVSAGLSAIFQAVPLRRQESRKPRAGARESCRPRFTMSGDRSPEQRATVGGVEGSSEHPHESTADPDRSKEHRPRARCERRPAVGGIRNRKQRAGVAAAQAGSAGISRCGQ